MTSLFSVVYFVILLLVLMFYQEITLWTLFWVGRILFWLGFKAWDTGAAQVKAHHKRVEQKEAMLQDPKQMLLRPSNSTPTKELLRPARANKIEVSGELLRPSTSEKTDTR